MQNYNLKLPVNLDNSRLDKAICELIPELSRTRIQKAIKDSNVKLNNLIINDSSFKVKENDLIELSLADSEPSDMQATKIELNIVYEDQDLIVINKQPGLTVHPGAGNYQDTLANALIYHSSFLSDIGGIDRPGIVHRLDKDTSGLMVVAKNNFAHASLAAQIEQRTLIRKYKALIWGVVFPPAGVIATNISRSKIDRKKMTALKVGGKQAITNYKTEKIFLNNLISLVECKLETGRTHQIRVHLSHVGHSIIGDQVYGHNNRKVNNCPPTAREKLVNFKRQALHSCYIAFVHPKSRQSLEFKADFPADIKSLIDFFVQED